MADQSGQIQTNALAPAEAESDGLRVKQQSIGDQIKADQYAARAAGAKQINRGLRFTKISLPGAASDQQGTDGGGNATFDSPGI